MPDQTHPDEQLRAPHEVKGPDGTRSDGRPTDQNLAAATRLPADDTPTEAPEEQGETPSTEHAPGGDL